MLAVSGDDGSSKLGKFITEERALDYQHRIIRGGKVRLPDLVVMLRRGADEVDAGLHAGERDARRAAARGNAARPGDTVSTASGI